tara:strand:+ start:472 stop:627 length:156 start_codon:yes stop_codon:yes gene_type:complete
MSSKPIKTKKSKKDCLENIKTLTDCKVSKASNEIMLDRFYNGEGIQFPFSQ